MTPLLAAVDNGFEDTVDVLLAAKSNPNVVTKVFCPYCFLSLTVLFPTTTGRLQSSHLGDGAGLAENDREPFECRRRSEYQRWGVCLSMEVAIVLTAVTGGADSLDARRYEQPLRLHQGTLEKTFPPCL